MAKHQQLKGVSAVLWKNVAALMQHHWDDVNFSRLGRDAKIGNGGAVRLRDGASIGVKLLERVADYFKVSPSDLLDPAFDPKKARPQLDEHLARVLAAYPDLTPRQRKRLADTAEDYKQEALELRHTASGGV